ncbi:MAG TPA: hypothetical protein VI365_13595 [Trebonia sp.]
MFGPNGQQVLMLIAAIPGLSADQVDQVTVAWKQGSPDSRARAWAHLSRATGEDERYGILAAASLARREALETARRVQRADWAFWAAACDAGAAAAAGKRIGGHYDALIAPFAGVVAILAADPAPVSLPLSRGGIPAADHALSVIHMTRVKSAHPLRCHTSDEVR